MVCAASVLLWASGGRFLPLGPLVATRLEAAEPTTTASPLADAAEQQQWSEVKSQLANISSDSPPIDRPQVDGMTALHWAVWHDQSAIAKLLLSRGANARAANRYGVQPLSLACLNGNAEVVESLLAAGADADTELAGGETALMTAARTGSLQVVQLLITAGSKVDAKEHRGQTALMWAAAEGHADVVRALIDAGANYETPLPSGFTPLLFACREGRPAVVQVLLEHGVDVNAVHRRTKSGSRAPRNHTSPLIMAIENGHFQLAKMLLEAGADPNDQRSGYTPLHTLTWVRKPNRGDGEDGDPAPHGSGTLTSLQLVRELVRHGADVNARLASGSTGRGQLGRKGATPLLLAASTEDLPYVKLLVELGADPLLANDDHCTPLHAAAGIGVLAPGEEAGTEAEALEMVAYLLERGAEINAVDDNGETTMHGAAYKNLPRMVDFLAAHGADRSIWDRKNKYGWTPLDIARGHRPGNFKPSEETQAALRRALGH
ncbi:MAG: ankyrin repeat domain-containing protein [Aureliella sp.]